MVREAIRWAATGSPYVPRAISKDVFDYLRARGVRTRLSRPLTPRETEVCRMVAEGHTVAQLTRTAVLLRLIVPSAGHPRDGSNDRLFDILGERTGVAVPLHGGLSLVAPLAKNP